MIKLTIIAAVILAGSSILLGQATCKAPYNSSDGGYTICPGDALKPVKPGVFVKDLDPTRNTFVLMAGTSTQSGTISELGFAWTRSTLQQTSEGTSIKYLGKIKTDSGVECAKVVIKTDTKDVKDLTVINYFCQAAKPAIIVASFPGSNGADLSLAESIVKTFAIRK